MSVLLQLPSVLSASFGKAFFFFVFFFARRFIINETILFWLTISYQKPFVFFRFCVPFSNIYPKINLRQKTGLTYAISIVMWFFWKFWLWNYFFTFLCWIQIIDISQQYCENFRKNEQPELVKNLPPSYLPFKFLHNLHSFLLWEKVKIFDVLKTND